MRKSGVREHDVEYPASELQGKRGPDKGVILVSILSPGLLVAALLHSMEVREPSMMRSVGTVASSAHAPPALVNADRTESVTRPIPRSSSALGNGANRARSLERPYSTEFGWEGPDLFARDGERTLVAHFRFETAEIDGEILDLDPTEIVSAANRIEYRREPLTEWYEKHPGGWEQGFTIARAPAGNVLRLEIAIRTTGPGMGNVSAYFFRPGAAAWDADGNVLPVRVDAGSSSLALTVDVSGARYPLIVFPMMFDRH